MTICLVEHCFKCQARNKYYCLICESNYIKKNGKCLNKENVCNINRCFRCPNSQDGCIECEKGYYTLDKKRCLYNCDGTFCLECNKTKDGDANCRVGTTGYN